MRTLLYMAHREHRASTHLNSKLVVLWMVPCTAEAAIKCSALRPAAVQEAEGGILLIGAYMRILQSQGGQRGDVSEAESRLLTFCRRFVADAAEDAWARHQAALATGASDIHTWDEVRSCAM